MRIFAPLRHRPVAWLWAGQVASSVGDEVNRVALAWLATSLWSEDAAYVSALYAGAAFVSSLVVGRWADRWSRSRAMIWSDVVRGVAVLALPICAALNVSLLPVLLPVVVITACSSTVFEPALRASIPEVAPNEALLSPTNALMESTIRLARVVGPSVVAFLSAAVPMIQFFTLDAVTFLLSAASVVVVARKVPALVTPPHTKHDEAGIVSAYRLAMKVPVVAFLFWSSVIAAGAWLLVLPTGMALLVHHRFPGRVDALATLIAAYGVGNLASNLIVGSLSSARGASLAFLGRLICGVGFVAMASSSSLPVMAVCAAFAATGGPMTDLGFFNELRRAFAAEDLTRLYRLAGAFGWSGVVLVLAVAPMLFAAWGVVAVLALAGVVLALSGVAGFVIGAPSSQQA